MYRLEENDKRLSDGIVLYHLKIRTNNKRREI